jgi:hypothetical protein
VLVALWLERELHRRVGPLNVVDAPLRTLRSLVGDGWVAILGLLLLASLQNIDVIVAKHTLDGDEAGSYAAAAVAAKAIVWVAIGVGLHLLPEATRRAAAGLDPRPVLLRALGIVGVVAAPALLIFAVAPRLLLRVAFGPELTRASDALLPLGAAMTLLAVAYLTVQYMLALGETRFLWVLAVVALAEPFVLAASNTEVVAFAGIVFAVQGLAACLRARPRPRRAPARAGPHRVVRRPLWPVVACALALYVLWAGAFFAAGHEARDFIKIGYRFVLRSDVSAVIKFDPTYRYPPNHDSPNGYGFDGQTSYYIALDPEHARAYLDLPAFRYARVLYPAAARLLAAGRPRLVPWTLILVNLLAIGGGVWALAAWLRRRSCSPWFALLYGLYPGLLLAFQRDLTEPLAYGLVPVAVYVFDFGGRRRLAWAALLFGLAVLARQTTAVFALCYAGAVLLAGDPALPPAARPGAREPGADGRLPPARHRPDGRLQRLPVGVAGVAGDVGPRQLHAGAVPRPRPGRPLAALAPAAAGHRRHRAGADRRGGRRRRLARPGPARRARVPARQRAPLRRPARAQPVPQLHLVRTRRDGRRRGRGPRDPGVRRPRTAPAHRPRRRCGAGARPAAGHRRLRVHRRPREPQRGVTRTESGPPGLCYGPAVLRRRLALATLLSAVIVLLAAAPGAAAKRRVPFGFFGVNTDASTLTGPGGDAQAQLMVRSGVESVRVVFNWSVAQPAPGRGFNFGETDSIVRVATAHGPARASDRHVRAAMGIGRADEGELLPLGPHPATYAAYAAALVGRYGPRGSFWAQNPTLPRRPLRDWQIWNEPAASYFWTPQPYAKTYTRLLRAADSAIHRADPRAKVLMAGLNSTRKSPSWDDLDRFYRAGVRHHYDVLALHPFSLRLDRRGVLETVRRAQAIQRKRHDRGPHVWLTELSWPASKGKIARSDYLGFEVTARVQAQRLTQFYKLVARKRRALRIDRVFWYAWSSTYQRRSVRGVSPSFQFSGLNRLTLAGLAPMPLLTTYAKVARSLEGCSKLTDATRCG